MVAVNTHHSSRRAYNKNFGVVKCPEQNIGGAGLNPGENVLFVQTSADILVNQRRVHLITCLRGRGCKRTIVLAMEDRVFIYRIIIIIIN